MALVMLFSLAACKGKEETETETAVGTFYTLQEAYDQGLLTVEDLKNISYYNHDEIGEPGFTPKPKDPSALDKSTEDDIRKDYFHTYVKPQNIDSESYELSDVGIKLYYGTYNGSVVIKMKENFDYGTGGAPYYVEGIEFDYVGGNHIVVWKVNS